MTDVAVEQLQPVLEAVSPELQPAGSVRELPRRIELGMLVVLIAIEACWLAAVGVLLLYVT